MQRFFPQEDQVRRWPDRPREEANLFNPGFCGALAYEFVNEFSRAKKQGPSLVLIFCALPAALHLRTRSRLPNTIRTSFYSWIEQNADDLVAFPAIAVKFVPYTQEAIRFCIQHSALVLDKSGELKLGSQRPSFGKERFATPEIGEIVYAIRLLGRWLAAAGSTSSVLAAARLRAKGLEDSLNLDEVHQRVDTFLNLISRRMSEYSDSLELEHSGSVLRLDIKNLTIVADTADGPVPLTRMGSGENWVGYHVLAHLALHWWFRQRTRPVPAILVFDQPSQAHYPPEMDEEGRLDPLKDEDRRAVHQLFRLIDNAATQIGNGIQIIVLDHAHINEDWFESKIIAEWRQGEALIPSDWIQN